MSNGKPRVEPVAAHRQEPEQGGYLVRPIYRSQERKAKEPGYLVRPIYRKKTQRQKQRTQTR